MAGHGGAAFLEVGRGFGQASGGGCCGLIFYLPNTLLQYGQCFLLHFIALLELQQFLFQCFDISVRCGIEHGGGQECTQANHGT
ncbi:hypothetical protein A986_17938 [Pseudomonas fluorescens BRIP34879]|nr:hypothetical protein A986_17938 [Pseudomonas fluorescens BRIP34879]